MRGYALPVVERGINSFARAFGLQAVAICVRLAELPLIVDRDGCWRLHGDDRVADSRRNSSGVTIVPGPANKRDAKNRNTSLLYQSPSLLNVVVRCTTLTTLRFSFIDLPPTLWP
jgi:hypothetical protein